MELKVVCDCGQKYKFDVVPVNGQMPFTVNCPICGVDGTPTANQLLGQQLAAALTPPPLPSLEPPPAAGGLRINRPAPAAAAPPLFSASATTPPLPTSAPAPAPRPGIPIRNLVSPPVKAQPTYNLWLGILGAFLGSALGSSLMYGFILWTGFRMPLTGTLVGAISGFASRALARGGDATLGAIAATLAALSVLSVFYFGFHGYFSIGMIISIIVSGSIAYKIASY